jgi:hypothetical protein
MNNKQGQMQVPYMDAPPIKNKYDIQGKIMSAITLKDAVWKQGARGTITITFGNPPSNLGCEQCNEKAAWSYIGSQSNNMRPSMNLGFIDPPYKSFTYKGKTYNVPIEDSRNYCMEIEPLSSNQNVKRAQETCKRDQTKEKCGCERGWVPGATVVHEFGHAIGMLHEHQNNLGESNKIKLYRPGAIQGYMEQGYSRADAEDMADTNVSDMFTCKNNDCTIEEKKQDGTIEKRRYDGTNYDEKSIMLYFLPDSWLVGGGCSDKGCPDGNKNEKEGFKNPTLPNFTLSTTDINWLKRKYPTDSTRKPEITVKFIDSNPEPWKMAWVEKVVMESYGQKIGIKWIFINSKIERTIDKVIDTAKGVVDKIKDSVGITDKPEDTTNEEDSGDSGDSGDLEDSGDYVKCTSVDGYTRCNSDSDYSRSNKTNKTNTDNLTVEEIKNIEKTGTKFSIKELTGIIVGSILGFLILALIIFLLARRR